MKRHGRPSQGFTLVETIAVMVVMAIAVVVIGQMQSGLFGGQTSVTSLQVASGLQLECAEQVVGVALAEGYDQVSTTSTRFGANKCDLVTAYSPYTVPTVSFTEGYTGSGCPTSSICKLATITQSTLLPLTVLLVKF